MRLLIFILLFPAFASAQYDSTKKRAEMTGYGYQFKNIKVPGNGSFVGPTDTLRLAFADSGAIASKNGTLYAFNGRFWTASGGFDTTDIRYRPTAGDGISITGSYPSQTIAANPDTLVAGAGITLTASGTKKVTIAANTANLDSLYGGKLDSVVKRGDTLRSFAAGDSTLIGTVSGGGGGTLQEDFDAAPGAVPQINAGENYFEISADYDGTNKLMMGGGEGVTLQVENSTTGTVGLIRVNSDGWPNLRSTLNTSSHDIGITPGKIVISGIDSSITRVGIGTESPETGLDVGVDVKFRKNGTPGSGKVATGTDADGNWTWQTPASSGITTAQLTDSLNAREPRYKFRDDSTGNGGYTTLYQRNKLKDSLQANIDLKANIASPTFTGTVTTPMLRVTGRTSLQGVSINKDSLPITTTNRWAVTVDTPTNMLQRFDLERKADTFNQVFTGSISLNSTTGGIGLPAMTQTQMNAISSPAVGVQVYNTTYDAVCTNTSDFGWWSNDGAWQRANGFSYSEEFLINTTSAIGLIYGNFAGQQNNSSALQNVSATSNRPGIVQLSTQSSATGRPVLVMDAVASRTNIMGGGKIIYETQVQIPALSSASETFNFFTGLSSSTSNVSTNAIAFLYDSAGTNTGSSAIGRWQVVCSNGSSRSYTTTNVQVTAGQWYSLRAVINAAGTQVDFFIDGTPVRSETNNIPTGGVSYTYTLAKTNGTTARTALVDYFFMRQKFTTTR